MCAVNKWLAERLSLEHSAQLHAAYIGYFTASMVGEPRVVASALFHLAVAIGKTIKR